MKKIRASQILATCFFDLVTDYVPGGCKIMDLSKCQLLILIFKDGAFLERYNSAMANCANKFMTYFYRELNVLLSNIKLK